MACLNNLLRFIIKVIPQSHPLFCGFKRNAGYVRMIYLHFTLIFRVAERENENVASIFLL